MVVTEVQYGQMLERLLERIGSELGVTFRRYSLAAWEQGKYKSGARAYSSVANLRLVADTQAMPFTPFKTNAKAEHKSKDTLWTRRWIGPRFNRVTACPIARPTRCWMKSPEPPLTVAVRSMSPGRC